MNESTVRIAGLELANPIMPASGTWSVKMMRLLLEAFPEFRPGCVVRKGISYDPWPGNDPPRIIETPGGMINFIGLQNPGVEAHIRQEHPLWREFRVPLIDNISGKTPDEYIRVIERLEEEDVDGYEVNLSCPNLERIIASTRPDLVRLYVRNIRPRTKRPLIVKLTPNVTHIDETARIAEGEGADAISAVNTFLAMAFDPDFRRQIRGGLSGPAIKAMALRKVEEICKAVKIPVIGMGGISTAEDAKEFINVGAKAVAIGTANFKDPLVMAKIAANWQKGESQEIL